MRYRPLSNREITLPVKLNQEASRRPSPDLPVGENYARFKWYRSIGLNKHAMALIYGVVDQTMANLWKQDDDEQMERIL